MHSDILCHVITLCMRVCACVCVCVCVCVCDKYGEQTTYMYITMHMYAL